MILNVPTALKLGTLGVVASEAAHAITTSWPIAVGMAFAAVGAVWQWGIKPIARFLAAAARVHHVLLGDDTSPSLTARLEQGDRRFGNLEEKVDELRDEVSGDDGVKPRIGKLEQSLGLMATQERRDMQRALTAADARTKRRRSADL